MEIDFGTRMIQFILIGSRTLPITAYEIVVTTFLFKLKFLNHLQFNETIKPAACGNVECIEASR